MAKLQFFYSRFGKTFFSLVLLLIFKIFLNYLFVLLSYSVVNERSTLSGCLFYFLSEVGGPNVDSSRSALARSTSRSHLSRRICAPSCRVPFGILLQGSLHICAYLFVFAPSGALVGQSGLEPPTSRLSAECSNQLSYWPMQLLHSALVRRSS